MTQYLSNLRDPKPERCVRAIIENSEDDSSMCGEESVCWPVAGIGLCWEHEIEWRRDADRIKGAS